MTRPPPDDAPAPAPAREPGAVRWTATAIAVAVAFLLAFNAASPRSWTAQLPPGAGALLARRMADGWWTATNRLGLAAPRAALVRAWEAATAARFSAPARRPPEAPTGQP
jgi:hypothetical protein